MKEKNNAFGKYMHYFGLNIGIFAIILISAGMICYSEYPIYNTKELLIFENIISLGIIGLLVSLIVSTYNLCNFTDIDSLFWIFSVFFVLFINVPDMLMINFIYQGFIILCFIFILIVNYRRRGGEVIK